MGAVIELAVELVAGHATTAGGIMESDEQCAAGDDAVAADNGDREPSYSRDSVIIWSGDQTCTPRQQVAYYGQ